MRRNWGRLSAAGLLAVGGAACSHIEIMPTSVHEDSSPPGLVYAEAPAEPQPVRVAAVEPAPQVATLQSKPTIEGVTPPFDAQPGECYAQVTQPAVYREVEERVVVEEAGERVVTTPATYKLVTERVLVEPEQTQEVLAQATYKTVVEEVVVAPARERVVEVPARYETRSREVLVEAAYTTWKRGVNPIAYGGSAGGVGPGGRLLETAEHSSGEVMCLVQVPAKYETVVERVMVSPPSTRIEVIPAVTKRVTRRVIDQPAGTRVVTRPARYQEVTREVVDRPAETRVVQVPARYGIATRQELAEAERTYWAEVLCETNADRSTIRHIQRALRRKGFPPGPIDGLWGPRSDGAARRFQRAIGGPRGVVTLETLRELGLDV